MRDGRTPQILAARQNRCKPTPAESIQWAVLR